MSILWKFPLPHEVSKIRPILVYSATIVFLPSKACLLFFDPCRCYVEVPISTPWTNAPSKVRADQPSDSRLSHARESRSTIDPDQMKSTG